MKSSKLLRLTLGLAKIASLTFAAIGIWIGEKPVAFVALGFFGVFILLGFVADSMEKRNKIEDQVPPAD